MGLHEDLDTLLGIRDTDEYGTLRDRLADADDCLLEELVTLRKQKRLTQEEVALRMGRSKTAVSNFERLGSDPHLSTIRRYAAAIGALVTHQVRDYDIWRMTHTEPLTLTFRHLNTAEVKERPKATPAGGMHWTSLCLPDLTASNV